MADDADKAISTTLLPPSASLLPPSAPLPPPSDGGNLLKLDAKGGEALVEDMARVGAGAKELAARASAFVTAKAPGVRQKVQETSAKLGELAGKALKEGAASAMDASAVLADPKKRSAMLAANRKTLIAALVALAVVLGGAWGIAKRQANIIARDRVEDFLTRYNLRKRVAYDDISGSPFGSATLSGVRIAMSSAVTVKAAALTVADIEMKGDIPQSVSLTAQSIEAPLLAMAKEDGGNSSLKDAIGMGYTHLNGDVSMSVRFDDQEGALSVATSGAVRDGGSWKIKLRLAGVSSGILNTLYGLSQKTGDDSGLGLWAAWGLAFQALSQMTLSEASLTVDNTGLFKRAGEIPGIAIPPEDGGAALSSRVLRVDEAVLVQNGMSQSDALATRDAIEGWAKKGGTLRVESNLAQPVPFFKRGGQFTPRFDSLEEYLAATKSKVTN